LIQSVVKYFHSQPNGKHKIDLKKINNEYYDLNKLYFDYYGKHICDIPLKHKIIVEFEKAVGSVDMDSKTKDLPYAHFDAETFKESNERVMNFTKNIMNYIKNCSYHYARIDSAKSISKLHNSFNF